MGVQFEEFTSNSDNVLSPKFTQQTSPTLSPDVLFVLMISNIKVKIQSVILILNPFIATSSKFSFRLQDKLMCRKVR